MGRCHAGFSGKLEVLKYAIQVAYFLIGLYYHFKILRVLYAKWNLYSKFSFYKLFIVDSILNIVIILLDVGAIRIFAFIPALCPWALSEFPEPSQWISFVFIEQYLKFSKCLIFCFIMFNRASCVLFPTSHGTIYNCIFYHMLLLASLCPLIGMLPIFISDSQFIPFQGGFIHESRMKLNWMNLNQFTLVISVITLVIIFLCSFVCLLCMSRAREEHKYTEQCLTAFALSMSIFYVLALSIGIFFQQMHASSLEMAEFWKALTMFSFDILLVCPPVIMLILNVRLRMDVFQRNTDQTPNSAK
ncbi:unnamed protein product [Caenorhabditis sp. 36 PRJEB53466]|nr:unnamed protein product [Caenorhabditis sp. 36 PRJEB53466]